MRFEAGNIFTWMYKLFYSKMKGTTTKVACYKRMYQWSETFLLHAYLINNNKAKIMFCENHLHYERKKELKEIFPEYILQKDAYRIQDAKYKPFENIKEHFPSSTYIRIK